PGPAGSVRKAPAPAIRTRRTVCRPHPVEPLESTLMQFVQTPVNADRTARTRKISVSGIAAAGAIAAALTLVPTQAHAAEHTGTAAKTATAATTTKAAASAKTYPDNLDGWIRE